MLECSSNPGGTALADLRDIGPKQLVLDQNYSAIVMGMLIITSSNAWRSDPDDFN